ncbi:MAG: Rne/Rng family ribonuclease [Candidatus Scalindua sp.]|nr:Rne/Rng family ribonuclease [Candidatus Scalindua sp.]
MKKKMLVNVVEPEESRIAILEDGVLEELYIERISREQIAGNIYKGRVVNIEPSIEAAFVDIGLSKNGFLHASDVRSLSGNGEQLNEEAPRIRGNKASIKSLLKLDQEVLVQVIKEGMGDKGPSLTTFISIPGRYLVLMPEVKRVGVSRKIPDEAERKRLKQIIEELKPPPHIGFIVRTAGENQTKRELSRDLNYLQKLWKVIDAKAEKSGAPSPIYQESDLVIRTIRDIFTTDIDEIIIDSEAVFKKIRYFLRLIMPRSVKKLRFYSEPEPLFHKYQIENEIEKIHKKEVRLPRGGSIVIEQTEALVAIDVNSGKYREESDPERTAFKTNLKAAKEIARQIRLRDMGGVIIIDFIDMKDERNIRSIEKVAEVALKRDRARTKILKMSKFGIIEMTRQRIRPSLKAVIYERCKCCEGTGEVKTIESTCLDLMRQIKSAVNNAQIKKIEIIASDKVTDYLLNLKRRQILELEGKFLKEITIRCDTTYKVGEITIHYCDKNGNRITIK